MTWFICRYISLKQILCHIINLEHKYRNWHWEQAMVNISYFDQYWSCFIREEECILLDIIIVMVIIVTINANITITWLWRVDMLYWWLDSNGCQPPRFIDNVPEVLKTIAEKGRKYGVLYFPIRLLLLSSYETVTLLEAPKYWIKQTILITVTGRFDCQQRNLLHVPYHYIPLADIVVINLGGYQLPIRTTMIHSIHRWMVIDWWLIDDYDDDCSGR